MNKKEEIITWIKANVFMTVVLLAFILAIVAASLHKKAPIQMTPKVFQSLAEELEKRVDNYIESEAGQKELECWEKVQNNDQEGFKECMEEWRKLRDKWWEKNKERFSNIR